VGGNCENLYSRGLALRQRQTSSAMTDGEPFLVPGLRIWIVRMIEDGGDVVFGGSAELSRGGSVARLHGGTGGHPTT
jgi:hypothetical protein